MQLTARRLALRLLWPGGGGGALHPTQNKMIFTKNESAPGHLRRIYIAGIYYDAAGVVEAQNLVLL